MGCCYSCDMGLPCQGTADPYIVEVAGAPFPQAPPCQVYPFADDPGCRRYANRIKGPPSTLGDLVIVPSSIPGFPSGGDEPPITLPVPSLPELPPPEGAALPPTVPALPGVVTEEQAAAREAAAFDRGKQAERADTIKTAAIGAAVSAVVGIVLGRMLSR